MSDPVPYDQYENYFINNDISPVMLKSIKTDYNKDFFKNIAVANSEYFLFDLFADASFSLLKWNNGTYTTLNYIYKSLPGFYADLPKEVSVFSHKYTAAYLEVWKKAANEFFSKLKEFFPENRIIYQKSRRTLMYKGEGGVVEDLVSMHDGAAAEIVDVTSEILDQMERYMLQIVPNLRVIDLAKYNFIADSRNPQKLSTNHYESNYYKTLLLELKNIVE